MEVFILYTVLIIKAKSLFYVCLFMPVFSKMLVEDNVPCPIPPCSVWSVCM